MATLRERDFFAENVLSSVGRYASQLPKQKVTGFLSVTGYLYDHKLMVIGRAVNGWADGILPHQLSNGNRSTAYAAMVFKSVSGGARCPMTRITECWSNPGGNPYGYNSRRSAFWRVIRAVVGESGIANVEDPSWPSYLVWSNLYKISPADGGNPSNTLCNIQLTDCISLLELELSTYNPNRLLFLTGLSWAEPFLEQIAPGFTPVENSYVEAIGQTNLGSDIPAQIVTAVHPQGKTECRWVTEVMEGFKI
jgi:hypothetical protein